MTTRRLTSRGLWRPIAVLASLTLVVGACGDDGDDTESGDGGGSDVTIGVLSGAVEGDYATQIGVPEDQIDTYDSVPDLFDALTAGRIDTVALTAITVREQVAELDGFEATEGFFPVVDGEEQKGCGAFAFRYGDQALRAAFNDELDAMQEAGEVLPIIEPFGFTEQEVTSAHDVTAADLAGGAYDNLGEPDGDIESYRQDGLTIGIANERPYGYEEDGEATGEAPELGREIFSRLGIDNVEYEVAEFGALINGLNAERLDAIAAGMFITPDRAEQALFADPDYCAPTAFAVPEGNPDELTDFAALAGSGEG